MGTRIDAPIGWASTDGSRSPPPVAQVPGSAGATDVLGFPDVPRLELDELLAQLVDRAGDVQAAQGRLRGLLRANALVAGDLSLPVVLRRIVVAARDLLGARYAALGVIGRDGGLEQFVHAGMDDGLVARIGELPRGRGILGLLTSEPVPIRLADLSAHPAAAGFPPGHPPMGSFLGVPVRIGEEVFGNLYLTERSPAGSSPRKMKSWRSRSPRPPARRSPTRGGTPSPSSAAAGWTPPASCAAAAVRAGWAAAHADRQHAAAATGADFAALAVPREPGQVIVTGVGGPLAAGLMNQTAPLAGSLAGQAIITGKPALVTGSRLQAAAAALGAGSAR